MVCMHLDLVAYTIVLENKNFSGQGSLYALVVV